MDITEYQEGCKETAIYRDSIVELNSLYDLGSTIKEYLGVNYCAMALNGEAGEIAEHIKKALRDDSAGITPERREALFKELGDVAWYLAMLCTELGFKLEDVMEWNLTKLQDRKDRGALSGSGSDR